MWTLSTRRHRQTLSGVEGTCAAASETQMHPPVLGRRPASPTCDRNGSADATQPFRSTSPRNTNDRPPSAGDSSASDDASVSRWLSGRAWGWHTRELVVGGPLHGQS